MKKEIVTLMGATASGKTAIAMQLADEYPIDIISVDSALIYKGMNIGTAKPTADELAQYPHQLIDLIEPNEVYSVADFRRDAIQAIEQSHNKGRIPLLVGGTMMYFKGLLEGLSPLPTSDASVRKKIEQEVAESGWVAIHEKLKAIDPISAQRIHPNDPQRLNRAYEVYLLTGKSLTELTEDKGEALPYKVHEFAIQSDDRALLHERIEKRFVTMLEQGFEQEVIDLMSRGDLSIDMPSMRSVGYRQMWEYLSGQGDYDEMVFKGICATRQLAKRQITWLRGWKTPLNWVEPDNFESMKKILRNLL